MAKKEIIVDWRDEKSIKQAEKQKHRYENEGGRLIEEKNLDTYRSRLVYDFTITQKRQSTCEIRLGEIREEFNQMRKRDLTKEEVESLLQDVKYYSENCTEESI